LCVDTDDDYCASNPCMNGAECRRLSGGFTCSPCPLNVTGARCELGTLTYELNVHGQLSRLYIPHTRQRFSFFLFITYFLAIPMSMH